MAYKIFAEVNITFPREMVVEQIKKEAEQLFSSEQNVTIVNVDAYLNLFLKIQALNLTSTMKQETGIDFVEKFLNEKIGPVLNQHKNTLLKMAKAKSIAELKILAKELFPDKSASEMKTIGKLLASFVISILGGVFVSGALGFSYGYILQYITDKDEHKFGPIGSGIMCTIPSVILFGIPASYAVGRLYDWGSM